MSATRDAMIAELKRVVVPRLRELGFKGSFPQFRRATEKQVELLTFQFSMGGGQFVVEIGKCPLSGLDLGDEHLPAEKVKMQHLMRRLRLGAKDASSDHWFNYDDDAYTQVAESILPYLDGQARKWWGKG